VSRIKLLKLAKKQYYPIRTHPEFEHRGIATALATYAVDFARRNPRIDCIFALVNHGTFSERIVEHLGFKMMSMTSGLTQVNMLYTLETHQ